MNRAENYKQLQEKTAKRTELLKELQTREEHSDFKYLIKKLPIQKLEERMAALIDIEKNIVLMVDKINRVNSYLNITGKNNLTLCQL